MAGNGLDLVKLFAMQAQAKKKQKPLKNVTQSIHEVSYIKRDGTTDKRPLRLFLPNNKETPLPLVYIPHYEMKEDSLEIRDYLQEGWAVASCSDFLPEYNTSLTYDDLVFNNAALYHLRHLKDIDNERIAVVGGSAGGYTAMMLSAMQSGICCTVANGPICNVYFNSFQYFEHAQSYNLAAIAAMSETERKDPIVLLTKLPLPFIGAICAGDGFTMGLSNAVEDVTDMSAWEAISPTAFADCYCNPIYINQATSDLLVPIDQLTKKYTYSVLGKTLPEGFDYRLREVEGLLNYSLCELLEQSELNLFSVKPLDKDVVVPFVFDKTKRYNVCVCDEGAPEAYASHNLGLHTGRTSDIDYLKYMFSQTASKTNILTKEKLALFAERYEGKARQLIAHQTGSENIYGSLSLYQQEITEQLGNWIKANGEQAFMDIMDLTISKLPKLEEALKKIKAQLIEG